MYWSKKLLSVHWCMKLLKKESLCPILQILSCQQRTEVFSQPTRARASLLISQTSIIVLYLRLGEAPEQVTRALETSTWEGVPNLN